MRRAIVFLGVLAACAVWLGGCNVASSTYAGGYSGPSSGPTATVRGTISGTGVGITGSVTVALTRVYYPPYSAQMTVTGSPQSGTYSVSGVPVGTYTLTVSFSASSALPVGNPMYSVNGGASFAAMGSSLYYSFPSPYYRDTITISNLSVPADVTLDLTL